MHHATGTRLWDFLVERCEQLVGSPTYLEATLLVERHLFLQCQEDGVALRQNLFSRRGQPSPRRGQEHEGIAMEQANVLYDLKQLVRIFLLSQKNGKDQPGRGHKITQTPRSPACVDLALRHVRRHASTLLSRRSIPNAEQMSLCREALFTE